MNNMVPTVNKTEDPVLKVMSTLNATGIKLNDTTNKNATNNKSTSKLPPLPPKEKKIE